MQDSLDAYIGILSMIEHRHFLLDRVAELERGLALLTSSRNPSRGLPKTHRLMAQLFRFNMQQQRADSELSCDDHTEYLSAMVPEAHLTWRSHANVAPRSTLQEHLDWRRRSLAAQARRRLKTARETYERLVGVSSQEAFHQANRRMLNLTIAILLLTAVMAVLAVAQMLPTEVRDRLWVWFCSLVGL
jgi:hypothetical protein